MPDQQRRQGRGKLPWSLAALNEDLATQQAYDPRIGTTLDGAQAPIVVVADGTVAGQTFTSYNQTARPAGSSDPTQPSLIAGSVETGAPNSTLGDLHAEMDVIQQAANKNLTQGQDMTITVSGQSVCPYCRSNLGDMANCRRPKLVDCLRYRHRIRAYLGKK